MATVTRCSRKLLLGNVVVKCLRTRRIQTTLCPPTQAICIYYEFALHTTLIALKCTAGLEVTSFITVHIYKVKIPQQTFQMILIHGPIRTLVCYWSYHIFIRLKINDHFNSIQVSHFTLMIMQLLRQRLRIFRSLLNFASGLMINR